MARSFSDPLPKNFTTAVIGTAYVLIEDLINDPDLEDRLKEKLLFVGSHDDLNLYQIWYNKENPEMQLRVTDSFVPVVRRVTDGDVHIAKSGCRI